MRSLQSNDFIERFTATGTFSVPVDDKVADLKRLLSYAVEETGIGACRKMGYGRGILVELEEVE
jgi:CRISPR/Cas system CMR subunit Cmr6 (Cas7 group RAMP superfamily)